MRAQLISKLDIRAKSLLCKASLNLQHYFLSPTFHSRLLVYRHIAQDALANASLLSVDDAHTRINDVTQALAEMEERKEALQLALSKGAVTPDEVKDKAWYTLPWGPEDELLEVLDDHFDLYPPFEEKVLKRTKTEHCINELEATLKLQTTVITCSDDSELTKEKKGPSTPISYANRGRRPFVRYLDEDRQLCEGMLDLWTCIAEAEELIGQTAITPAELVTVRLEAQEPLWRAVMDLCWEYLDI